MGNFWSNLRKIFFLSWSLSILFLSLESFSYSGLILKHTGINPLLILVICLVSGLLLTFNPNKEVFDLWRPKGTTLAYTFNRILFFVFTLGYLFLLGQEISNYRNYVFSKFHIDISLLLRGVLFLGLIEAIKILEKIREMGILERTSKFIKSRSKSQLFSTEKIYAILFLFSSFLVLANNLSGTSKLLLKNSLYIIANPFTTYAEKMRYLVGGKFYDYTQFVKDNTPENATILIPPQGYPWPQTGNRFYLRYFLYPRTLINGEEFSPKVDLDKGEVDFVLVVWGESSASQYGYTNGWPKFDVKTTKAIYWKEDGSVIETEQDYNFNSDNYNDWGLIEVKK